MVYNKKYDNSNNSRFDLSYHFAQWEKFVFLTAEEKEILRKAVMCNKILDKTTGKIYLSQAEFAKALNITSSAVTMAIKRGYTKIKGHSIVRIEGKKLQVKKLSL